LGVGLQPYPVKRKLLRSLEEIQPDNGRSLWRRPWPELGCGAEGGGGEEEEEEEKKKKKKKKKNEMSEWLR
jgi:hypothetical protein